MKLTRKRDNIHWTSNNLLSYNKTYNFAVSGRGPGKTTDIMRFMMNQHKKGYYLVVIKRLIKDVSETTLSDLRNAYNVLVPDEEKIDFTYSLSEATKGKVDVYITGEDVPFFRMEALSCKVSDLKAQAFDRELSTIIFDEYKISKNEKYLKDEYFTFSELYSTLCRWGIQLPDGTIKPPRVIFLGNNYSLTDPYMANLHIPINQIKPGKIITGDTWAFEDIKISDELKAYICAQNPLFSFGNDAYNKYALDGISVSDQRIKIVDKQPDNYSLQYVFSIEDNLLGIYSNNDYAGEDSYWVSILEQYNSKRRDIACFNYVDLVEGNYLISRADKLSFSYMKECFRYRKIAFKSLTEGYLFEQIYDNI